MGAADIDGEDFHGVESRGEELGGVEEWPFTSFRSSR